MKARCYFSEKSICGQAADWTWGLPGWFPRVSVAGLPGIGGWHSFSCLFAEAQHAQMANEQLASKPSIPPWRYLPAHESDSDHLHERPGAAEFRLRGRDPCPEKGEKANSGWKCCLQLLNEGSAFVGSPYILQGNILQIIIEELQIKSGPRSKEQPFGV